MSQICPPSPFVPTLFSHSYLGFLREALHVVLFFCLSTLGGCDVIRLGWTDGLLRQTKWAALIFIPTNDFTAATMVLMNLNLLNSGGIPSSRMTVTVHSFVALIFQVHYKLISNGCIFSIIRINTKDNCNLSPVFFKDSKNF